MKYFAVVEAVFNILLEICSSFWGVLEIEFDAYIAMVRAKFNHIAGLAYFMRIVGLLSLNHHNYTQVWGNPAKKSGYNTLFLRRFKYSYPP